jgi:cytidine deaminase
MAVSESQLVQEADAARRHSIAPFSKYPVGAALQTSDSKIFRGCNIENSSYGLTMCAERVALFNALASGERRFAAIAVVAPSHTPPVPCGACRQVLWEHCGDIDVVVATPGGETRRHRLSTLLPHPFEFRGPQ